MRRTSANTPSDCSSVGGAHGVRRNGEQQKASAHVATKYDATMDRWQAQQDEFVERRRGMGKEEREAHTANIIIIAVFVTLFLGGLLNSCGV